MNFVALLFLTLTASAPAEVFVPKKLCGGSIPCAKGPEVVLEKKWIKTEELPLEKSPVINEAKRTTVAPRERNAANRLITAVNPAQIQKVQSATHSNLPEYLKGEREAPRSVDQVVLNTKGRDPRSGLVRAGDMVSAVIEQQIVASPSVPTPIRAMAISGPMKGSMFLGEARLDSELKRVLIEFIRIRPKEESRTLNVKASGLSLKGSVGLEGEYVSHAGKFFVAEFGAAVAAGAVDASIQRNQNSMGNYVQEPSLANQAKTGLATALSRTADRAAEAVRQAPEYTKTEGYQEIKILIREDPTDAGEV